MTTIYLIRHAEAEGNLYRRAHGQYDSLITDNGYRQLAALAERFENERVDAVYASDLIRTRTTAMAVARVHGLPVHATAELREVAVGEWEDRTWAWLARFDRERLLAFNTDAGHWRVAGGESMETVRARMTRALERIIAAHPGQTAAVFSHGMALRLLIGTLRGLSLAEIDRERHGENTAVTKLEADERGVRVVYAIDDSHLDEALTTLHKQVWTKRAGGIEPGVWFEPDPEAEDRFAVMSEDARVGTVGVVPRGGVAEVTELRLDAGARGQRYGVRLLGQAVSCARAHGCDTLRAELPPGDAAAERFARACGFSPAAPGSRMWEKYVGADESRCAAQFDAAWAARKNAAAQRDLS